MNKTKGIFAPNAKAIINIKSMKIINSKGIDLFIMFKLLFRHHAEQSARLARFSNRPTPLKWLTVLCQRTDHRFRYITSCFKTKRIA